MKSIKEILNKKPDKLLVRSVIDEKTVIFIFDKVIREEMGAIGKEKLRARNFSNGTIFIKTESSAWASELWLNRGKIIARINEELGQSVVQKIRVN